jgi:heat shock protein HslJ
LQEGDGKWDRAALVVAALLLVFPPVAAGAFQAAVDRATQPSLEGTSWQLVQLKAGEETLTPEDRSRYTIEFAPGGQLYARVDCNRGRGSWKSGGNNGLELGDPTLTRVRCAKGSLHDDIVERWQNISSYKLENDRLFLEVGGGGFLEFEPFRRSRAATVPETEFRGIVSSVEGVCPALRLTVSGTSVTTNGSTQFECHTLRVGAVVQVQGSRGADGSVVAARIATEDDLRRERTR